MGAHGLEAHAAGPADPSGQASTVAANRGGRLTLLARSKA